MSVKGKLTNEQITAQGTRRTDNGEIEHKADKIAKQRKSETKK